MPDDTVVVVGKFLKISDSVCKSSTNTVEQTCVVTCNMECFETVGSVVGLLAAGTNRRSPCRNPDVNVVGVPYYVQR